MAMSTIELNLNVKGHKYGAAGPLDKGMVQNLIILLLDALEEVRG